MSRSNFGDAACERVAGLRKLARKAGRLKRLAFPPYNEKGLAEVRTFRQTRPLNRTDV